MKVYKLIKKIDILPQDWEIGMYLGKEDRHDDIFSPCSLKYTDVKISEDFILTLPDVFEFIDDDAKDDINNQNEDLGSRNNSGKLQWSLIDFPSLEPAVRVMEFGAKKYGKYNWKKGLTTTEICESMLRHIFAYLDGEDVDKESGLPLEGHILCNAMFLSYMIRNRKDLDTREKKK